MHHIHQEFDAGPDDVVEVALDGPANVLLLDPENYDRYRRNETYRYQGGGHYKQSPAELVPPRPGRWHVVIDLGGYPGRVRAEVLLLEGANAEG